MIIMEEQKILSKDFLEREIFFSQIKLVQL